MRWEDLILPLGFKPNIQRSFINPIKNNEELKDFSAIIFGPPGTGKTSLLKAIAKELGFELYLIGPQNFLKGESIEGAMNSYIVQINKIVKSKARPKGKGSKAGKKVSAGIIIAFDEIDELVVARDEKSSRESRFSTTMMLPLLQELHDLAKRHRFIFFSLTNHIERFDSAITRKDRFDLILPLGPPDRRARFLLFEMYLDKIAKRYKEEGITIRRAHDRKIKEFRYHVTTMDIDVVSRASSKLTLKDIETICERVVEQQLAYDNTKSGEYLNLETRYFIDWIYKFCNSSKDKKEIEKFYDDRRMFSRESTIYPKSHTLQQQVEHEFNSLHIKTNIAELGRKWRAKERKILQFSMRNLAGLSYFNGCVLFEATINGQYFVEKEINFKSLQPGESSGLISIPIKPSKKGALKIAFTIDGKIRVRGIEQVVKNNNADLQGVVVCESEVVISRQAARLRFDRKSVELHCRSVPQEIIQPPF